LKRRKRRAPVAAEKYSRLATISGDTNRRESWPFHLMYGVARRSGPKPTGMCYCIKSAALKFQKEVESSWRQLQLRPQIELPAVLDLV
jgi:hypothetical protein